MTMVLVGLKEPQGIIHVVFQAFAIFHGMLFPVVFDLRGIGEVASEYRRQVMETLGGPLNNPRATARVQVSYRFAA